jgi:hypothetical protein
VLGNEWSPRLPPDNTWPGEICNIRAILSDSLTSPGRRFWCRRISISASSRALERNKRVSAVHSSMRTSTIGHEHHPIRPTSKPYRGFRLGQGAQVIRGQPPTRSIRNAKDPRYVAVASCSRGLGAVSGLFLTFEVASRTPIMLQIAVASLNGYSHARNCGSSGECQRNGANDVLELCISAPAPASHHTLELSPTKSAGWIAASQ